ALSQRYFSEGWIPFAGNGAGDYLCIDMDPGSEGTLGQIFRWNHDDDHKPPLAPSLDAWLEHVVAGILSGWVQYGENEEVLPRHGGIGFFVLFGTSTSFEARFDGSA